ncbi:MAG TPA: tRNA preQ1(34) S-adenosylmethionine ribosyltransferase-isomerase QueA [Verrucomicrobia bacterium]|nr:MAG: tRNA preQ1(34) S-adenosylmethionine ribosyltransferase-isomerase QueA [Lentisphaerae bacterium GWF2_57_35]HBA85639.1 tRNA preQ1(34) S-adenosylmethionine ribosyltransferase-isomerase QueA [Verrucomicrobiota bacterium]
MKTEDFDYHLPQELIAQEPSVQRDQSRMLVLHRETGRLEHRCFSDLPGYLRAGDLMVVNDTRVIPARVFARKEGTGGKVELLMLEETAPGIWAALLRTHRRPAVGSTIYLGESRTKAVLLEDGVMGRVLLRIESDRPFLDVLEKDGITPLPPYIARKQAPAEQTEADRTRYQTVFAREPGAVAAPTAGLHFTPEVLARLELLGVRRATVTLHVGPGTFRPVSVDNLEDHEMESERYQVLPETVRAIEQARAAGGRVMAVGSTSVRTLESAVGEGGLLAAGDGRTKLFIHPPYEFRVVDVMLTNFHLPKSTLLMMISALAGRELILKAYEEAVREKYRFYSYGDCMLIL